jgi:hypothetical protein
MKSLLDELTNRQPGMKNRAPLKFSFRLRSIPYSPAAL